MAWRPMNRSLVAPLLGLSMLAGCRPGPSTASDAGDARAAARSDAGVSLATGSAFGVYGVFADEFADSRKAMGMSFSAYQDWAGEKLEDLGAHWSRSTMQLVWDLIDPPDGGSLDWTASFDGDAVFAGAAKHHVRYLAVFHEGNRGGSQPGKLTLRDPVQDLSGWKRFAQAAAERYDGDGIDDAPGGIAIHDWQIGNEIPGWTSSGRTADEYVLWFEAASQAIRAADPQARLVLIASTGAAKIDPFHKAVIAGLAAKGVRFEAIDLHHWGTASLADSRMAAVPDVKAALTAVDAGAVEIWSMEHGTYVGQPASAAGQCSPACAASQVCAATGPGAGLCVPKCSSNASCPPGMPSCENATGLCKPVLQSQTDQARSLVYRYAINRSLGVSLIDWNNLVAWHCFGGRCGSYFDLTGLVATGFGAGETAASAGSPYLSYFTYRMLAGRTDESVAEVQPEVSTGDSAIHVFGYRNRATNKAGVVAWADSAKQASIPWAPSSAHLLGLITDASGSSLRNESPAAVQGKLSVSLDQDPVWIAEDPSW